MEWFLKVAHELLKQFLIAIMKLESSFIKFLLNQATIWRNKFPELVTGRNDLLGYLGAASGQRFGGSIYQKKKNQSLYVVGMCEYFANPSEFNEMKSNFAGHL